MSNLGLPFDPRDPKRLKDFRMAAAGIIRDILSAIRQISPNLVAKPIQQQWWSDQSPPSDSAPKKLLSNASRQLKRFPDEFDLVCRSISSSEPDTSSVLEDSVQDLMELMTSFSTPDALQAAARSLDTKDSADWRSLCKWDSLPQIRSLLDDVTQFEKSTPEETSKPIGKLSTQPPNWVTYQGKTIRNVRPLIWKLLNYLLSKANWTSDVGELYDAIWIDDQSHKDEWGPVNSLLRDTRSFFADESIPYSVSGKKVLRQVFLTDKIDNEAKSPKKRSASKRKKPT